MLLILIPHLTLILSLPLTLYAVHVVPRVLLPVVRCAIAAIATLVALVLPLMGV